MEVLRTAILDKLSRKKGGSISTSEVVQQMYPEDWEQFLKEVNTTAIELYHEGLVNLIPPLQDINFNLLQSISLKISPPTQP